MKIRFFASSRADFGLVRPVIKYFVQSTAFDVELMCLGRASSMPDEYVRDGIGTFPVRREATTVSRLQSGGETVRAFVSACATVSAQLEDTGAPDWFLVPGDRFEIFAAVVAGYYRNVPVAHLFAGDRSVGGHLDDNVRHAISRLAHLHLAVSEDSRARLLNSGEEAWRVVNVGSPVVESVREAAACPPSIPIPRHAYLALCTYHPITTESEDAGRQFHVLSEALSQLRRQVDLGCVFTYPNNEPGSHAIVAELEALGRRSGCYVFEDLGWRDYLALMARVHLVIGNSSSGVLEAPILGVPTLNVGTRQKGRLSPPGVAHVEEYDADRIAARAIEILKAPRIVPDHPYGPGDASARIEQALLAAAARSRREILQKSITL
jgi:UDP-hydrolysing UDP-N-acetyl-D-glucosamine 2-epimerase